MFSHCFLFQSTSILLREVSRNMRMLCIKDVRKNAMKQSRHMCSLYVLVLTNSSIYLLLFNLIPIHLQIVSMHRRKGGTWSSGLSTYDLCDDPPRTPIPPIFYPLFPILFIYMYICIHIYIHMCIYIHMYRYIYIGQYPMFKRTQIKLPAIYHLYTHISQ